MTHDKQIGISVYHRGGAPLLTLPTGLKPARAVCLAREAIGTGDDRLHINLRHRASAPLQTKAGKMIPSLDFLKDLATRHGDEIAIDFNADQATYAELANAVNALAVALQMKDPARGSRIGLCAAYSLEYVVSVMAIVTAGKIPLPMNCHGDPEKLHTILNETHPAAIIVDELGDGRIHSDPDLKIHFSQFPGLVRTYRDHVPADHGAAPSENDPVEPEFPHSTGD